MKDRLGAETSHFADQDKWQLCPRLTRSCVMQRRTAIPLFRGEKIPYRPILHSAGVDPDRLNQIRQKFERMAIAAVKIKTVEELESMVIEFQPFGS